jgi:O-antigen/teichoic acid export membrane protein
MIGRKSLLIVISSLLSSVIAFFGILAITNYLGKDVYGDLAWVLATIGTLNIIADLGFDSAHIKRLSEGNDEADCFSTYLVIKVVLTMIMVTFTLTALVLWNNVLGGNMSPATWNLVILFVLYFALYDMANIVIFTFNAKMQTTKSQLIVMSIR